MKGRLGSIPDLRRISPARLEVFSEIVRGGFLEATGVPPFADSIQQDDLPALKAYLIEQAWRACRAQSPARSN